MRTRRRGARPATCSRLANAATCRPTPFVRRRRRVSARCTRWRPRTSPARTTWRCCSTGRVRRRYRRSSATGVSSTASTPPSPSALEAAPETCVSTGRSGRAPPPCTSPTTTTRRACGARYISDEQAVAHVRACTQAGLQAGFHCIGDAAVDTAVGCGRRRRPRDGRGERPGGAPPPRARGDGRRRRRWPRWHGWASWPACSRRSTPRGAARRACTPGAWVTDRAATLNPFSAFARAGVTLAFGSDSPVTAFDPWGSVRAAVEPPDALRTPSPRGQRSPRTPAVAGGQRASTMPVCSCRGPSPPTRSGTSRPTWSFRRRTSAWRHGRPIRDPGCPACPTSASTRPVRAADGPSSRGAPSSRADTPGT